MSSPQTQIDAAVTCLRAGGVVLLPTDTVLGLAVMANNSAGITRLFALKARPNSKNLPIMVANIDQIAALGMIMTPPLLALLHSQYVPGPLTLAGAIDPAKCPAWLQHRTQIAVRIPNDPRLLAILRQTGPLMVTSANLSGQDTPDTTKAAAAQLTAQPDLVLPGRAGGGQASTLVNCATNPVTIERQGAVSVQAIAAITQVRHD